jgi:hypothetical protein
MTLGEGKRKVLMIIDEYSSGGTLTKDDDINLKMNDFFDLAQRDVANHKPILKRRRSRCKERSGRTRNSTCPSGS